MTALAAAAVAPATYAVTITWVGDSLYAGASATAGLSTVVGDVQDVFEGPHVPFTDYSHPGGQAEARIDNGTMDTPPDTTATGLASSIQYSGRLENVFADRQGFYFAGSASAFIGVEHPGPPGSPPEATVAANALNARLFEFQVDTPSRAIFSGTIAIPAFDKTTPDRSLFNNYVGFNLFDMNNPGTPVLTHELFGSTDGVSSLAIADVFMLLPGTTYGFQVTASASNNRMLTDDLSESIVSSAELYLDVMPVPAPATIWLFAAAFACARHRGTKPRRA